MTEEERESQRKQEVYLKLLEKHADKSKERKEYAIKQFDTLMITISTAAVGFISTYTKGMTDHLVWVWISQILFLMCILTNLISHGASMISNEHAQNYAEEMFIHESYNEEHTEEELQKFMSLQEERHNKMMKFGKVVRILNVFSFSTIFLAMLFFVIFTIIS